MDNNKKDKWINNKRTSIINYRLLAMSCKGLQVGFAWLFKVSRIRCRAKGSPPIQPRRAVPEGWVGKDENAKLLIRGNLPNSRMAVPKGW